MQTTIASISSSSSTTVVKNDTSSSNNPSIKVDALRIPVNVTVSAGNTNKAQNALASMERARISWENTELAASNKRLYSILKDAYSFYLEMKNNSIKETRQAYAMELKNFIEQRGYTFMPSSHDMTRVVKCVFGVDRRRVSAYSIALREALRLAIKPADLTAFIEENGGVEQIRLGGSKPLSTTKRADKVRGEVLDADLGMLKFDSAMFAADADWADKQVVIVATYLPTGEFQANAVIRHDGATNAALAAYYSQQQANLRKVTKAEREADKAQRNAQQVRATKAKPTQAQQKGHSRKAKPGKQHSAASKAHFDTLFETQSA